jgi:hypothetical protein
VLVWQAVGMVSVALAMPAPHALALLRGHAYATSRTVFESADGLVGRRVQPEQPGGDADER